MVTDEIVSILAIEGLMGIVIAGFFWWRTRVDIQNSNNETLKIITKELGNEYNGITREIKGVIEVIKEDSKGTNESIKEVGNIIKILGEETLKSIKESHLIIKDELKELEKSSER